MGQGLGAIFTGDWRGYNATMATAYANGPLGQAEAIGPGTYYATVGALGVASAAMAVAVAEMTLVAAVSPQGIAVFWSGGQNALGHALSRIVMNKAREIAITHGGQTLEMTVGGRFLSVFGTWCPQFIWRRASMHFATAAGSESLVVQSSSAIFSITNLNVFAAIEYPILAQRGVSLMFMLF